MRARGGMTSHLAVVLRAIGNPGVTGASDLIVSHDSIHVGNINIPRHAYVYIDGNLGHFAFSLSPFQTEPAYEKDVEVTLLRQIVVELNAVINDRKVFSSLPVNDQLHMANLIQAFRQIGMKIS